MGMGIKKSLPPSRTARARSMKVIGPIIFIWVVSGTVALQESKGWRGIVTLRSTRAEAEALLGHASGAVNASTRQPTNLWRLITRQHLVRVTRQDGTWRLKPC